MFDRPRWVYRRDDDVRGLTTTTRRALVAGGALAIACAGAVVPVAESATARPPTSAPQRFCHGMRATIVGTPGKVLRGTKAADVIVSHGASHVNALGGGDIVCVTGSFSSKHAVVRVSGGPGDDVIDASGWQGPDVVSSVLGDGRDTFLGSSGPDFVDAVGGGSDRVFTRAGSDGVSAGGPRGRADHDLVHLGTGADNAGILGRDPTTRWYGDAGNDSLRLPYDSQNGAARHDWVYDVVRHGTFRNGARVQWWQGFERFDVEDFVKSTVASARSMRFVGGPGPEHVVMRPSTERQTRVNLGGGNDRLYLDTYQQSTVDDTEVRYILTAGPGHDLIRIDGSGDGGGIEEAPTTPYLAFDLPRDYFTTLRDGAPLGTTKGFEDIDARYFDEVDLRGDDEDNTLQWVPSCPHQASHLSGAGGSDTISVGLLYAATDCDQDGQPGPTPDAVLDGGSGNDTLSGGQGNDTLTGGDGTDTADGASGTDTCTAETTTNCEP